MSSMLTVDSIQKNYARVAAVDHLSFDVQRGEIFALLGPNGAGKTSTVRMLVGITRPDEGRITYHREDGDAPSMPAPEMGYLPEERGLFRETPVLRTLVYFAQLRGMDTKEAEEAARQWLERFDLGDRIGDKIEALSKGNQQKVQLVSSILHRPKFAILDEPFSGLDPLNQEKMLEILDELRSEGTTILLSAHQMNLVERIADRVLLMNRGRAVLSGTMSEIRSQGAQNKIVLETEGPVPTDALAGQPGIAQIERAASGEITLWLGPDSSLSEVLAAAGRALPIKAVHSERVSLHEIYVQAVGGSEELVAVGEEAIS